jgi:hypothetical protein
MNTIQSKKLEAERDLFMTENFRERIHEANIAVHRGRWERVTILYSAINLVLSTNLIVWVLA